MNELAYLNGKIIPIHKAKVPIEDRGYQFADAVYEVIAGYDGELFLLDRHLARLVRSCKAIQLKLPPLKPLVADMRRLLKKSGIKKAMIYIQISRGVAPRSHLFPKHATPQVVMTVRPVHIVPAAIRKYGAKCITSPDIRWGRVDIKTVNLLPNSLAKQAAHDAGCLDTIFIGPKGEVRETTAANLFAVFNNQLWTHPLTHNILPGITRELIIKIAKEQKIKVVEKFFHVDRMIKFAQEIFITGTTAEVIPMVRIDGKTVGGGKRGPITKRIEDQFQKIISPKPVGNPRKVHGR